VSLMLISRLNERFPFPVDRRTVPAKPIAPRRIRSYSSRSRSQERFRADY
jgi:hypothetical protein